MAAGQPLALPVLDIPVADGCLELVTVESGQSPPTWSFESYPLDALPGGFEIGRSMMVGRPVTGRSESILSVERPACARATV